MRRCPTCGARHVEGPCCCRCRTDLQQVVGIEPAAMSAQKQASLALASRHRDKARDFADRACGLHRSITSIALRALVAFADGEFDLALRLWLEIEKDQTTPRDAASHLKTRVCDFSIMSRSLKA